MGLFNRIRELARRELPNHPDIHTEDEAPKQSRRPTITLKRPAVPISLEDVRFPGDLLAQQTILETEAGRQLYRLWQASEKEKTGSQADLDRIDRLRHAVRRSRESSPQLHQMVAITQRITGVAFPYEVYTLSASAPNASAQWAQDRMLLSFEGPVDSFFSPRELLSVVGHEVGHYLMADQRFAAWLCGKLASYSNPEERALAESSGDPPPGLFYGGAMPDLILALSRFGEITADRVGLLCCQDLHESVEALAKAVGGPDSKLGRIRAIDFLKQADDLIAEGFADDELNDTHPLDLLRAKALEWFYHSDLYQRFYPSQQKVSPIDEVNARILEMLSPPVPDAEYVEIDADSAFVAFTALACYVIGTADGKITPAEERAVKALPEKNQILEWWEEIPHWDNETLESQFAQLAAIAAEAQSRRRLSALIGRLITIARADRSFSGEEIGTIYAIAETVGVEDLARNRLVKILGYDPLED